jgi:hypothetical protein
VALIGTFYATWAVGRVGTSLGVANTHNPVAWYVFAGGVLFTVLLAGVGYGLATLCAIYDRPRALSASTMKGGA